MIPTRYHSYFFGWLLATLPTTAWASKGAKCSSQWAVDACTLAAELLSPCSNGVVDDLQPLATLEAYGSGHHTQCTCSTVVYAAISACALCQEGTWNTWSEWSDGCASTTISAYPLSVPAGTSIPDWAFIDVKSSNNFDVRLAMQAAASGTNVPNHSVTLVRSTETQRSVPTSTTTASLTTSTQSLKSSTTASSSTFPSSILSSPSLSSSTSTSSSSPPVSSSSTSPSTTMAPSSTSSLAPEGNALLKSTTHGIIATVCGAVLLALIAAGATFAIIRKHRLLGTLDVEQAALATGDDMFLPPTPERKWDFVAVPLTPLTASMPQTSPTQMTHAPWFNPPAYSDSILHYLSTGTRSEYNRPGQN
ncbi:hypothetical protein FIBSPDRAFT_932851 [Athelia psychrophila]|uniref:Uncharacterized protein n=1 Tax=Athelia psychrophila TaxID=1759441 RepID=A0A166I8M5_9AGAM|nr:hypothetical protein FIBSPDRAFT_932851 [Fibularhizoctonia sp. CBS 109695]